MKLNEIKAARARIGASGADIANQIGLKPDLYYRRERGDASFRIEEIPKLIVALQLTPQEANEFIFDGKLHFNAIE